MPNLRILTNTKLYNLKLLRLDLTIRVLYFLKPSFIFILILFAEPSWGQQSPSDKYCAYLQELEAKALREKKEMSALESIINFVNDLTKKLTLETIEKEALTKKMSFEEFQKWANDTHSVKIKDHYKAKYLQSYIKNICGTITYSASFGSSPEADTSSTAEKQFDPTGLPYSAEVLTPENTEQKK